jgi:rhodanese-related sulfurtransferase
MTGKVLRKSFILALALCLGAYLAVAALDSNAAKKPSFAEEAVAKCKSTKQPVPMQEAKNNLSAGGWLILDVRTEDEFKKGHLPGAMNIPRGKLEFVVEKQIPDYKTKIMIYCKSGGRAALAACTLRDMGYSSVIAMNDGFDQWAKVGFPVE